MLQIVHKTYGHAVKHLISFILISYSTITVAQPMVNDEALISSLIERGVICEGLTSEEQQQALNIYLQKKINNKNTNSNDKDPNPTDTCISTKYKEKA